MSEHPPQYYQPSNSLAIWALVLGIIALVTSPFVIGGLIGLIAIGLGIIAARRPTGKGLAIVGIVLAACGLPVASCTTMFALNIHHAIKQQNALEGPEGKAQGQIVAYKLALESYKSETGSFPTMIEGLKVWKNLGPGHKPYLDDTPDDPWGHPYIYVPPSAADPDTIDVFSAGADGKPGTKDDITEQFGRP